MSEPKRSARTEARTRAQRERILGAARSCFVKHGFHAASMSKIAEAAGMSPGLIYRYFDSKSDIILEIIERQLACARSDIAALEPGADLVPVFRRFFTEWQRGGSDLLSPALLLEISAEATRDPQISQALAHADRVTGAALADWLRETLGLRGEAAENRSVEARTFLLRCFLAGFAVRAIREPDLDRAVLTDGLDLLMRRVLA